MHHDQLFPTFHIPDLKKQTSFAVHPKYLINNRSDKRAFRKDAIRAAEYLQWIIDDFIDALFDDTLPEEVQYQTVYLHYLDIWKKTIEHLKKVKPRLQNVSIDPEFFAKNYAPAA